MKYYEDPEDPPVIVDLPSSEYTARKRHFCSYCGGWIEPGTRYRVYKWTEDGEFQTSKVHLVGDHRPEDEQPVPPEELPF